MSADEAPLTVDLAREDGFRLRDLEVRPSTREVLCRDQHEVLEPRVMQVLVALARRRGEVVSRDDLIASCWRGQVVGGDAINRCINLIRGVANRHGGFSVQTVARVGYRLCADEPMPPDGSEPASLPAATSPPHREPLLAVLAFDNLSGDPEMTYFSDGVSEEILQTVARGADLNVIGRGSSFQFRGAEKAAAHVAHVLRATHVLDGSVRRSGDRVRISASLVECAGETMLWSDRFDRELSDVFALQDEIAASVAAALKVAFAPTTQAESVDPTAYTLYLKARDLRNRGLLSHETVVEVVKLLEEATRFAPRFARAWEFLSTMQVERLRFGGAQQRKTLDRADVAAAAQTALSLDPALGAAHQALGQLEPFGHFVEREAFHTKALSVAPSDPTVLTNASLFFAEVGRTREALDHAAQAHALDPMYPWVANWYGYSMEIDGRAEECRRLYEGFCARWPDNQLIVWGALVAAVDFGDWAWFDDLVGKARSAGLDTPSLRRTISHGRHLRDPKEDVAARYLSGARERLARTGVLGVGNFVVLSQIGLIDQAFELIDQASFDYMFDPEKGSPNGAGGSSMMFNPSCNRAMMRDIRFVGFCAKLGLCDYWVETGKWPDCADEVPYDFRPEGRRLAGSPTH